MKEPLDGTWMQGWWDGDGLESYDTIPILKSKRRIYGPVKYHSSSPTYLLSPIPTYPLSPFPYSVPMPDWKSPDEIQRNAVAYMKLMHSLAGIYMCIFPSFFLFILLTHPQVRVVHIARLWMGFYLREEEAPLAHGQHCRRPQLNALVTSEYRYFILRTDISCY